MNELASFCRGAISQLDLQKEESSEIVRLREIMVRLRCRSAKKLARIFEEAIA